MAGLYEGGNEPPGSLKAVTNELPVFLDEVLEMWLMHDEAPVHLHRNIREHLRKTFNGRWIGRGGFVGIITFILLRRLYHVDGINDSEMLFDEMRLRIRHRLPDIRLMVWDNLEKNPTT
ncbi:hypothetical protein ANN_00791 [Periplaneta americana]|uniref:Uncharacterized protein n=1 Tax=Periplaneta americana TaxID=6978 RepID=A0ABQ8TTJ7_PERAM|nr:hypothetical protein ANN_00791 [Periplaneta americana]